jgi:hypothetical protein
VRRQQLEECSLIADYQLKISITRYNSFFFKAKNKIYISEELKKD